MFNGKKLAPKSISKQQHKTPVPPSPKKLPQNTLRKSLRFALQIILFCISFVGFVGLGGIWDIHETQPTISVSDVVDPVFPLKLPFYVSNPGHMLTLHEVACSCQLKAPAVPPIANMNVPSLQVVIGDLIHHGKVYDILPGKQQDFDCGFQVAAGAAPGFSVSGEPVRWPANSILEIQSSYKLRVLWWHLEEKSEITSFYTYAVPSGGTHWVSGKPHFPQL